MYKFWDDTLEVCFKVVFSTICVLQTAWDRTLGLNRWILNPPRWSVRYSSEWTCTPRVFPTGLELLGQSEVDEKTLPTYQPEKHYPVRQSNAMVVSEYWACLLRQILKQTGLGYHQPPGSYKWQKPRWHIRRPGPYGRGSCPVRPSTTRGNRDTSAQSSGMSRATGRKPLF